MPTTRKKIIKTIYKDDDDSEDLGGDFSDSGSDAKISSAPSSDDSIHEEEICPSSDDEVHKKPQKVSKTNQKKNPQFAKAFISKINKQISAEDEDEQLPVSTFTIKDLTEADKLLPSVLNLSESDSSDDEYPKSTIKKKCHTETLPNANSDNDDNDAGTEYKDVWSVNEKDESEDIAKKTFLELEQHNAKVEEAKMSALQYSHKNDKNESDVKDLLALGEEIPELETITKKKKKKVQEQSDSEVEDWEEVKESKSIPQQGLQLIVNIPDSVLRKTKKVDVEDMMRRKINRVKKECQVYMHKVHVLCWLGYGNYISTVLNDQELMSSALSLLINPKSKGNPDQRVGKKKIEETSSLSHNNSTFYPGQRVDMKYVEQITSWYQNKLTLRKDKHEGKFRPKAPKLKEILIEQIKNNKTLTSKKYLVFVFVALLRALGLQCRVMLNFVTVPIKPPTSELQSLSKKKSDNKKSDDKDASKNKNIIKTNSVKPYTKKKISQLDGNHDYSTDSDSDISNIMQIDGNDDKSPRITRSTRSHTAKVNQNKQVAKKSNTTSKIMQVDGKNDEITPKTRSSRVAISKENKNIAKETEGASPPKKAKQNEDVSGQVVANSKLSLNSQRNQKTKNIKSGKNTEVSGVEEINKDVTASEFFVGDKNPKTRSMRKRSATTNSRPSNDIVIQKVPKKATQAKTRAKSTPVRKIKSNEELSATTSKKPRSSSPKEQGNKEVLKPIDMTENNSYKDDSIDDTKTQKSDSDDDFKVVKVFATHPKRAKKLNSSKQKDKFSTQDITKDQSKQNEKEKANSDVTAQTRSARASRNTKIVPKIVVSTEENKDKMTSEFFTGENSGTNVNKTKLSRKRSTTNTTPSETVKTEITEKKSKTRAKSTPRNGNTSKYFKDVSPSKKIKNVKDEIDLENEKRVSHKELLKHKTKTNNDVTSDLVDIIKNRVKEAKAESKKNKVKGTTKDSEEDSDHLPVDVKQSEVSDDDLKPVKISPQPGPSRRIDRRVLSDDVVLPDNIDVWCEVFVEELEEWVPVDVTRNKVHCASEIYSKATHPVAYIIGWDNNNYLKDLTRRYVPHWNTVTRKQRADVSWWNTAVAPWLGPKNARDKEEDERLDRMQLEAPLPTCISEYKNHPLYVLKRHLLKFEALYPPEAPALGFVRGEAVLARDCVHVCKSRDVWLKEAKVVRLGEKPYKVVTARPKWDKLSNKLIRDKPLEIFGSWQITDYEPPVAENGIVPRNAYGNVELFKECMLPKGTVYIKLPGLNRVAKKLNIDCAPAVTGFDFNGGWSHPVYEGFVVCKEYEEIITEAWVKDQEELERKEREKIDARVYGNWRRLIKGLFIRERLKVRYGFDGPTPGTSQVTKKQKGPRLVVKKTR